MSGKSVRRVERDGHFANRSASSMRVRRSDGSLIFFECDDEAQPLNDGQIDLIVVQQLQ
jgi:hypothetical protein